MISDKQKKILAFQYTNYEAIICDGAVRSGKTSIMSFAFVKWMMESFDRKNLAICGKTVGSAIKNVITPLINMGYFKERYNVKFRRSESILEVSYGNRTNFIEIFGGKDEKSQDLIQGRTFAGVLLDEVALMPQSFVNQALARCSVDGARFWFSCNPSNPQHWFYTEWIQKAKEHNVLYLHFEMKDNPSLSEETLHRYETMYSGVFYQRYILGQWVSADGLVYDMFNKEQHVIPTGSVETDGDYYISSDYGIQNATVFLLWQKEKHGNRWVLLKEYYYSGRDNHHQKTVAEHVEGLIQILPSVEYEGKETKILPRQVIVDPSATALIVELRKNRFHVISAKNDVKDGINDVSTMLRNNMILVNDCCTNTIAEFGIYSWDEKATERGEDAPLKENDHAMDAVRYFVKTMRLVRKADRDVHISRF